MAKKLEDLLYLGDVQCFATWNRNTGQYASGKSLYIGKIKVAEYYFNGARPKGDPKVYKVVSPIQTIKSDLGSYETENECVVVCMKVAKLFVEHLSTQKMER